MKSVGSYVIVAPLGAGTFGSVFKAKDPAGREVALKVLHDDVARDREVRERFRREARAALAVDHPSIVRILDAGEAEGRLFIASELCRGGSLASLIERGKIGEARALALALDVARALEALAKAGLVHRDVKPGNVLLDGPAGQERARLGDLGLARTQARSGATLTVTGELVGSPSYMAPEQLEAKVVDDRADVYALGVVLFELLAGQVPFRGSSLAEIARGHLHEDVPPVPGSPRLAELVRSLLAKDREKRPRAAEVVLRLSELAKAAPASSAPSVPYVATMAEGAAPFYPKTLAEPAAKLSESHSDEETSHGFRVAAAAPAPAGSAVEKVTVFSKLPLVVSRGAAPEPPAAPGATGLSRASLVLGGATLFVYGGSRLVLGRDSIDRPGQDVCLRLRPSSKHENEIRMISKQHVALRVESDGRVLVEDLGSSSGTTLDAVPLDAKVPRALSPRANLNVASVLGLEVTVFAPPAGGKPLVLVRRTTNCPEHAYLLVPGRAVVEGPGACELIFTGVLWTRFPGKKATPLAAGPLDLGGAKLEVREIGVQDQK